MCGSPAGANHTISKIRSLDWWPSFLKSPADPNLLQAPSANARSANQSASLRSTRTLSCTSSPGLSGAGFGRIAAGGKADHVDAPHQGSLAGTAAWFRAGRFEGLSMHPDPLFARALVASRATKRRRRNARVSCGFAFFTVFDCVAGKTRVPILYYLIATIC